MIKVIDNKEAQTTVTEVALPKIELNGTIGILTGSIDAVEITWDNSESDYYYVSIRNIETNPEIVNENPLFLNHKSQASTQFFHGENLVIMVCTK